MNTINTAEDTIIDPVCGKTVDPTKLQFTAKDNNGTHYFCSEECRRRFDTADSKTKKGFWAKYTERLKDTHCTRTPPECR